jgi:hypothetical protein
MEWESPKRTISLMLSIFIKTKDERIRGTIMRKVISRAFSTKPSEKRKLSAKVEPMYMKKIGTRKPKPKDESLCGSSLLCSKNVFINIPATKAPKATSRCR